MSKKKESKPKENEGFSLTDKEAQLIVNLLNYTTQNRSTKSLLKKFAKFNYLPETNFEI